MSRIGRLPINIPAGVTITISDKNEISVKGPKGELKRNISPDISITKEEEVLVFTRPGDHRRLRSLHGLSRSLVNNMIIGVTEGYKTRQELVGVGYRANANGQFLELSLGYSHDIVIEIPSEIKLVTESVKGQNPAVIMESNDKELIGMVAAKIRSLRKPEPYKGKGIRFTNEIIRRKAGKSAGKK